ncbi:MAG: GNAT family N-acetyltransferase [Oscillospiraceae bacterium]|nr:GNAT family N-acetyltransferase [Oscillospiraceae bacterium]
MQIIDFTAAHMEEAASLAKQNYEDEQEFVPALPAVESVSALGEFADNGLGVAAFEGDTMMGFLCGNRPWDNTWDIPGLRNVFSPMGANGVIGENRAKIYARLYQAAGEKWAAVGAASHAVCLYAHDREAQAQFFRYSFGMRCVDAIRRVEAMNCRPCEGYVFSELAPKDILRVLPMEKRLDESYRASPFFMFRKPPIEAAFLGNYECAQSVYFIAEQKGQIVAFIRAEQDGENFIRDIPGYLHIKGGFCLTEHRGKGLNQKLLSLLTAKLKAQGCTRLGVDFESINPTAWGFWLKYFTAYTHSLVRRIDENVLAAPERMR